MRNIRRKKYAAFFLCAALTAMFVTGCGKDSTEIPDLSSLGSINVISREEGSGTKTEFETLIDTDAAGTDQIADSTDTLISDIQGDRDAIGYAAYSSISDASQVKILRVDGVTPDEETIQKDTYPLCREYILVYTGSLSDVEADFLSYVTSAGQIIVATYCVPVKTASTFLSDKSSGEITIHGSTSTAPIIQSMADDYMGINPNAKIEIVISDSTQGLNDAMQGKCDFGMSSRSLKSYESELLTSVTFGKDAVAVIVNQDNPLNDISVELLKKIYDKDYEDWTELE